MAKGRIADNKPKVIARLEKRVRRGEGSAKLLEYEAWVVDWLRENPLPQWLSQKDIYRLANRAWQGYRSGVRQAERETAKRTSVTIVP
jgi:hypothetical protein